MSFFLYTEKRTDISGDQRKKIKTIFSSFSNERIHRPPFKVQNYSKGILGSLQQTDHIINDSGEAVFGFTYGQSHDKKDGNYIIISPSEQGLNLYTDVISSFTLWYYLDQHLFIASTSQRAIIKYIGSFELNENVIPWILSTGNLGPEISWDNRIKKAKPDSILQFNRHEWTIHESYTEPNYNEKEERSDEEWLSLLVTGYDNIHQKVAKIYSDDWFLPLSGGYDSRGILTFLSRNLKQFDKLKTVTWGVDNALHENGTDATIAREVATHYNISHRYYLTEDAGLNPHTIFQRFFLYGEGRIDQFSGYMDGFQLWKDLYNNGYQVSMRGDTFFKSSVPYSELSVLTLNKLELMSDYSNLKQLAERYSFPDQRLPSHFKQKENESLNTWFYRLRHIHLHQCFVSALTQLKSGFTIQINPLITYHTFELFRKIPDHQQQAKNLFIKMIKLLGPDIPVATIDSVPSNTDILMRNEISEYLYDFLNSGFSHSALPPEFIKEISLNESSKPLTSRNSVIKRGYQWFQTNTPAFIKKSIRSHVKSRTLHPGLLAFRVYLLIRMEEVLKEDAGFLNRRLSKDALILPETPV